VRRPVTEGAVGRAARLAGRGVTLAIGVAPLAWPAIASACAVCFGGKDSDWPGAFVAGTMIMLALPPAIIVFAGVAIYRGIKRQEARQAALAAPGGAEPRSVRPLARDGRATT
jgi:hypothetical protein